MKKFKYWMLGLLVLCFSVYAYGSGTEENGISAESRNFEELKVGNTTHLNGDFFTDMWGNATSDLDVRKLLHGYNLVSWNFQQGVFQTNPTVISGFVATKNSKGDHIYQIALYDDLKYSDGSGITAWDYAFSVLLSLSPQMEELGARTGRPEYILGAADYRKGNTKTLAGVRVLNDYEMTVTVDAAYLPYFYELGLLNFQPWPISAIAPGVVVKDDGNGVYLANEDASVSGDVFSAELLKETLMDPETGYRSHPELTSGPYMLESFDGTTAAFRINPYFKGDSEGAKPSIPRLVYTVAYNDTMIGELESGTFDLLNKISSAQAIQQGLALTTGSDEFAMSGYPRSGLSFAAFTGSSMLSENETLRKVFAWCLDRGAITSGYESSYGLEVKGYYGIGQWMFSLLNHTSPFPIDESLDEEQAQEQRSAWEALSLDGMEDYSMEDREEEIAEAVRLLEEDGWTLDENGSAYDSAVGGIRYKELNGELVPLSFSLVYPEGNAAGALLEEYLAKPLQSAGVRLEVKPAAFSDILADFYGQSPTGADVLYLASNFDEIFDPAENFRISEDGAAVWGTSGIVDNTLYDLAVDMRRTAPGDVYEYCRKWAAFQERFSQTLPLLPVYSNVYFDFYTSSLQNYEPMKQVSWAQEILYAFYGDAPKDAGSGAETADLEEGDIIEF